MGQSLLSGAYLCWTFAGAHCPCRRPVARLYLSVFPYFHPSSIVRVRVNPLSLHQSCRSLLSPSPFPQPPTPASLVWVGVTFRSRGRSGSRRPGLEAHGLDCLGLQPLAVCYLLKRARQSRDHHGLMLIAARIQPPAPAWCTPVGDGAFSEP